MTDHVHEYGATATWKGSTGVGYDDYVRAHSIEIDGCQLGLKLSGDKAFRGDPALANPEQLLLAAAVSCQLLSFLAVAARARIDVVAYEDAGRALMPENDKPIRITKIELHPHVTIAGGAGRMTVSRLEHLVRIAHDECFIANSLRSEIVIRPTFSFMAPPGA